MCSSLSKCALCNAPWTLVVLQPSNQKFVPLSLLTSTLSQQLWLIVLQGGIQVKIKNGSKFDIAIKLDQNTHITLFYQLNVSLYTKIKHKINLIRLKYWVTKVHKNETFCLFCFNFKNEKMKNLHINNCTNLLTFSTKETKHLQQIKLN